MQARSEYPAGVPCWVDLSPPDPEAAVAFYAGLFGWEYEDRMPADAPGSYFVAHLRGRAVGAIGSPPPDASGPPAWSTYVAVDDADVSAARVAGAGGGTIAEPFDVGSAGRMGVFADPSGAVFSTWQAGETVGAEAVNEHGAWNFSDLHTPDPEAAERFYGEVFGWERSPFDPGDPAGPGYWRRPGYGDFLEETNPGTRARNAEMGAPDRFEDAVATLAPLTDAGTTPHWGVTFATEDADATAAKAAELDGTIVVPPTDAPWVRFAVVSDPQGAMFVASQFVPPT